MLKLIRKTHQAYNAGYQQAMDGELHNPGEYKGFLLFWHQEGWIKGMKDKLQLWLERYPVLVTLE